jgi:hypothetical protein
MGDTAFNTDGAEILTWVGGSKTTGRMPGAKIVMRSIASAGSHTLALVALCVMCKPKSGSAPDHGQKCPNSALGGLVGH